MKYIGYNNNNNNNNNNNRAFRCAIHVSTTALTKS